MRAEDETTLDVILIAMGVGAATFLVMLPVFVTPKVAWVVGEHRMAALPLVIRLIIHSPVGLGIATIAWLVMGERGALRTYLAWAVCFGVASALVCTVVILQPMFRGLWPVH